MLTHIQVQAQYAVNGTFAFLKILKNKYYRYTYPLAALVNESVRMGSDDNVSAILVVLTPTSQAGFLSSVVSVVA